jgi:hypothetical protein
MGFTETLASDIWLVLQAPENAGFRILSIPGSRKQVPPASGYAVRISKHWTPASEYRFNKEFCNAGFWLTNTTNISRTVFQTIRAHCQITLTNAGYWLLATDGAVSTRQHWLLASTDPQVLQTTVTTGFRKCYEHIKHHRHWLQTIGST